MKDITDCILPENVGHEDILDVIIKVEQSFGFRFKDNDLSRVKTFGELCDIIILKINCTNDLSDCTTQQAFYKVRNAISATLLIDNRNLTTATNLKDLFKKRIRIQNILNVEILLGFKIKILEPKIWVITTFLVILISSFFILYFNWLLALTGFTLSILGISLSNKYANEFNLETVGQLADKISRENYKKSRRDSSTVNKKEIIKKVKDLFINELGLEEESLIRESLF